MGRPFWAFTIAWTVFSLGNSADVFLLLRAKDLGLSVTAVVLSYALYNTLYSGLSWPLGHLSDRVGKRRVLAVGLLVFAGVYAGFGLAGSGAAVWPLMAIYGIYIAATDGVSKALVSDLSPAALRATGQGAFKLATGAAAVAASLVAGVLWQTVGPGAVFALGAGAALLGLLAMGAMRPREVARGRGRDDRPRRPRSRRPPPPPPRAGRGWRSTPAAGAARRCRSRSSTRSAPAGWAQSSSRAIGRSSRSRRLASVRAAILMRLPAARSISGASSP